MNIVTVTLADASEAQLRQIAKEQLGLSVHPNAKPDTIRAKIQAATDKTEFSVTVGEASRPQPKAVIAVQGPIPPGYEEPVPEPWYTIVIQATQDPAGDKPVPVSVAGRNMFIKRGEPSRIKHRYYHALANAVQTVYDQPDGPTGEMVARQVQVYPMTVVAAPSQAELDAWAKYKADVQAMEVAAKEAA